MKSLTKRWVIDGLYGLGAEVELNDNDEATVLMDKKLATDLGLSDFCRITFKPEIQGEGIFFAGPELFDKIDELIATRAMAASADIRLDSSIRWPTANKAAQFLKLLSGKDVFHDVMVETQTYCVCFCRCCAVSDEKREIIIHAAVNTATGTISDDLGALLESLFEEEKLYPRGKDVAVPSSSAMDALCATLRDQANVHLHDFSESLTKRLTRDSERIHGYYSELLASPPSSRKKNDPEEMRQRSEAIKQEYGRKIDDLKIKYLTKVSITPVALLFVSMPCACAHFTVHMGNASRDMIIPWNPITSRPDSTLCVLCRRPSETIRICREFHWLCDRCWKCCAVCQKEYCPICKPKGCSHG